MLQGSTQWKGLAPLVSQLAPTREPITSWMGAFVSSVTQCVQPAAVRKLTNVLLVFPKKYLTLL